MSMIIKQSFSLIVTVVNRGYSDNVINVAKENGAEGATILSARGTGVHETGTFFGVNIQPEKEVVLIVMKKQLRKKVMRAIVLYNNLNKEGMGICFSLPLDEVAGVYHLFQKFKKQELSQRLQAEEKSECQLDEAVKSRNEKTTESAKVENKPVEKMKEKAEEKTQKEKKIRVAKKTTKEDDVAELKRRIKKEK